MGTRKTGKNGYIKIQKGVISMSMHQLTGESDNKTFAGAAGEIWSPKDVADMDVRVDGVRTGLSVIVDPDGANDNVDLEAGTAYVAGTAVTKTAETAISITRAASIGAGEVQIHAIVMDSSGTVSVVAGTKGAAGGARGAAGGAPYITVDKILLAYVTIDDSSAAPIVQSEIDNDSAERADIPGYKIDYIEGEIVFTSALEAIHTGDVTREVWASYKKAVMVTIADITGWNVTYPGASRIDTSASGDDYESSLPGQKQAWSGSCDIFNINSLFHDAVEEGEDFIVNLYEDDNVYHIGQCSIGLSRSIRRTEAAMDNLTLNGTGRLKRVAA